MRTNAAKDLVSPAMHDGRARTWIDRKSEIQTLYRCPRLSSSLRIGATADLNSSFESGIQRVTRTG